MEYLEFLKRKIEIAKDSGFTVKREEINPALKPHQKDAVIWALKGGRRALFESFGLGKTIQEIEFCHQAINHHGGKDIEGNEYAICRECSAILSDGEWFAQYCPDCGKKVDWREEE